MGPRRSSLRAGGASRCLLAAAAVLLLTTCCQLRLPPPVLICSRSGRAFRDLGYNLGSTMCSTTTHQWKFYSTTTVFFFLLKESGFFFFDCTSLDPNTSLRSGACSAAFRWMQEIPESIRSYDSLPGRGSLSTRPCVYPVPVSPLRGCKLMPPSIPPNCKATVQGVKTRTGSRMCSNPTQSRHPMKRTPWPA